ncbi:hypothetical protein PG993_004596 [Apiospora rasikravindrae]|uniref:Uncharacterized protein n=1 Tax=Apiospora rasikravindrae TaxID=990691 RepID=A0ABR1TDV3_9PEZI
MRKAQLVLQPKLVLRQRDDDPGPARGAFVRRIFVLQPVHQRLVHGADRVPLHQLVDSLEPAIQDRFASQRDLCGLGFPGGSDLSGSGAESFFVVLILVLILVLVIVIEL